MLLVKPFSRSMPALCAAFALFFAAACGRPAEEEPVIQVDAAVAVKEGLGESCWSVTLLPPVSREKAHAIT